MEVKIVTNTEVELRRNDGSETFILKASSVELTVSNGLVMDSIISASTNKILGSKLVLDAQVYQIDATIQGMDSGDYPNSSNYSDHDKGFRDELKRASLEWGYTASNGFDTLYYDSRTIDGVITEYSPLEDLEQRQARTYDATIEFSHLSNYV